MLLALYPPGPLRADGTEALGPPSVTIQSGTGLVAAGTGLAEGQPGTIEIEVPADASVRQVLLYWSCQYRTSGDAEVTVGSSSVSGVLIGGPTTFFRYNGEDISAATYRADISDLGVIKPGPNSVEVGDLNCGGAWENSGAGLLVIYATDSSPAAIDVRDGQDLAFRNFAPPLDTTVTQTFHFLSASTARVAKLWLFVSSVLGLEQGGPRPNVVRVTVGGTALPDIVDALSSGDGKAWDTLGLDVEVPAGATEITVQVLSEDAPPIADPAPRPASLNWLAAGLSVPTEPAAGACTQGYWKNHPGSWPAATLTLGAKVYARPELLALLRTPTRGDASLILAHQLIAAKLNLAAGSDPSPVSVIVAQADGLLASLEGKLPLGIRANSEMGAAMTKIADDLDEYNNGTCREGVEDASGRGNGRAGRRRGAGRRAAGPSR